VKFVSEGKSISKGSCGEYQFGDQRRLGRFTMECCVARVALTSAEDAMLEFRWIGWASLSVLGLLACGEAASPNGSEGASGSGQLPGAAGIAGAGGAVPGSSGSGSVNGGSPSSSGGANGGTASGSTATGGKPSTAGTGGVSQGGAVAAGAAGSGGGSNAGSATGGSAGSGGGPTGEPGQKTLRVFWLRPSDVPFDQKYPDGIGKVVLEAQKYYKAELGKTFKVNNPIVETVVGDHVKSWYENTPNGGEKYWWSVTNMQQELTKKFGLKNPDSRWMIVGEVSAEGEGAGGGGSPGWVILCQHDADGAAGIGGTINRWYGGMVHELGHAFGLPDAASTDGTPMSASLYDYPNTHFSQSQKDKILNGGQSSFLF
jgi:hypothetical protein